MDILLTLKILVSLALVITSLLATYERFVLQPVRIKSGIERSEFFNQVYELIPLFLIGFGMIFFTLEKVLTFFTLLSVVIVLLAKLYLRKSYKDSHSVILEQAKSYVVILVVIWFIRSFMFQPYIVPTGSLEPTIQPGDFIIVSQYSYGIRIPILGDTIINIDKPKTGDIALFRWPLDPDTLFIKRVIGVPGDHIQYKNKKLTINGKQVNQEFKKYEHKINDDGNLVLVSEQQEVLPEKTHLIQIYKDYNDTKEIDIVIPKGNYFMMGDNRDNSNDSRFWGLVPEKNLVGKALGIWLSISRQPLKIRWSRMGTSII